VPIDAQDSWARVMFTLNSRDLRMWSSMISLRIMSLQEVMVKSVSGSASLSGPVVLETEEQMLEREQNER